MHGLGIASTRALSITIGKEPVYRESVESAAMVIRLASSHVRFGSFEYFHHTQRPDLVKQLADYVIEQHLPDIQGEQDQYLKLFRYSVHQTAKLIAQWQAVGFAHGVMNTDNTTISGETIDYGPAAYMDEFRHRKVFSSIDQQGRYAYANQAPIAQWNLARLAESLLVLGATKSELEAVLAEFPANYERFYLNLMRPKLGLQDANDSDHELIREWLDYLERNELDYTLSFRALAKRIDADDGSGFGEFESRWRQRIGQQEAAAADIAKLMNSVNPLFIPRNHRVEQAIDLAVDGDLGVFEDLNNVLVKPFDEQPEFACYAEAPERHERVTRTYCGT